MHELFMAVCLATSLACEDVGIVYVDLDKNVFAEAAIGVSGRYYIMFDPMKHWCELTDEELVIHEVAHLLVFEVNPENDTHDAQYRSFCRPLAQKFNKRAGKVCSA